MMEKQINNNNKSKIPTWQTKINHDKDRLEKVKSKIAIPKYENNNNTSSSSSSIMSIRADSQAKLNNTNNSQTQLTNNKNNNGILKSKSKLYKPSIIEKKKLPSFKSKLNSNLSDKKLLFNNQSKEIIDSSTNCKENKIPVKHDRSHQNKFGFKANKILKESNNKSQEPMDDEHIYQKVFLNKKAFDCKDPKSNTATNNALAEHSIETLKESINEFKKKFSSNISCKFDCSESKNTFDLNSNDKMVICSSQEVDKKDESESDSTIKNITEQLELNKTISEPIEPSQIENQKTKTTTDIKLRTEVGKNTITRRNFIFNSKLPKILNLNDTKLINKSEMINSETSLDQKTVFRNKTNMSPRENRSQSQEEILEEFKNSLNELIKASKWTKESEMSNRNSRNYLSLYGPSFNIDEHDIYEKNKHENDKKNNTLKKSSTLMAHQTFNSCDDNNSLKFKNHTFSIDNTKSSEYLILSPNRSSDLSNTNIYIQMPQVKQQQADSIGNHVSVVSPLSSSVRSTLNTSLSYSSDSAKSSLINIQSSSSNNLNDSTSSSSSTTLQQTIKQTKNDPLLTSNKKSTNSKITYLAKEDPSIDTYHSNSNKRFSTTSEILTKKSSNKDLIDKKLSTFQSNLTSSQRKSIPTLSTSESVSNFQNTEKTYAKQYKTMMNSIDSKRFSEMKTSTGKSLSKLQVEVESSSSIAHPIRKSANSWIAQSFRKAFSKIDKRKLIKSQSQLNQISKNNNISSLSINFTDNDELNIEKCHSDDENENYSNRNKLSLVQTSNDCLLDSESDFDYDDNLKKSEFLSKHSKNLIMTKRSYRSESELAFKNFQKQKDLNINNNHHQITSSNNSSNNYNNKTSNLITINNNMSRIKEGKIPSNKLGKSHKSVTSLLTTSTSSNQILDQMNSKQKQSLKQQDLSLYSPSDSHKFMNKCNCKLNETMVTDLKKKLTIAENKLTDIRLEALSSIHQIDQLKECMDKMKDEMIELKSENQALKKYICEIKCEKLNLSDHCKMLENLDSDTDKCELSNKIVEMFQFINRNMTNYYYSYNFLLSDENEMLLRKALVTIDCSYELQFSPDDDMSISSYRICEINVDSKVKWPLMDGIVSYIFKRYINKVDPNKMTGLSQYSIDKYKIGDMVRKINDSKYPDLLPFGYLIGNNCVIKIILKDYINSLDSLSYESSIPKYLLEDYVNLLDKHRLIAISSQFKFGKTYLMYKLSQFMCKNSEKNFEILFLNIDELLTGHFCNFSTNKHDEKNLINSLTSKIDEKLSYLEQLNQSLIILLDNFHILFNRSDFNSMEFLNYICNVKNKHRVYFIITSFESSTFQIPIDYFQHFKWINLNINHVEFLQFYLNRNLINYQVDNNRIKESCAVMEKVVWFVCEVYKLVNQFISKLGLSDLTLMPLSFMSLPFGSDSSEKWFIELWNYSLVPYLNDLFKIKIIEDETSNSIVKQYDPTNWIIKNYVWSKNSNSIPLNQRLLRFKINENFLKKGSRSSSSSNDSDLINSHELQRCPGEAGTHLVSMLLRLQKATNLSNKEENLSSGFYDSTSSSSSTSSTSPNCNLKQTTNLLFNNLANKTKMESSL